jgi:hypothetical protein
MTTDIKLVLNERGSRYGDFSDNARVSASLRQLALGYRAEPLPTLHEEALVMILHKVARIICGDHNYADNWIDIAGYATLVVERLGKEKE